MVCVQINQLAYFAAVARTRHFTHAAAELGVAQPTLSKQIRVLENSLGTALFDRQRTGIELTSAGEALLPHAERILIDVENASRAVHEVSGLRRGLVRLGATPSLCDGLVPEALTRFHQAHPDIKIVVHEAGSQLLTADLLAGRLDLALVIGPIRAASSELVAEPLLREELVVAAPAGSPLGDAVEIDDLRDISLVMFREGYDLRETTVRAFLAAGFEPRSPIEGGEMSAVLRFVEAGLGHAIVPRMVMAHRPELRLVELRRPALEREVLLAHRADALQLASATFREQLLELTDVHQPSRQDG